MDEDDTTRGAIDMMLVALIRSGLRFYAARRAVARLYAILCQQDNVPAEVALTMISTELR